jgi:hypothetical protein
MLHISDHRTNQQAFDAKGDAPDSGECGEQLIPEGPPLWDWGY